SPSSWRPTSPPGGRTATAGASVRRWRVSSGAVTSVSRGAATNLAGASPGFPSGVPASNNSAGPRELVDMVPHCSEWSPHHGLGVHTLASRIGCRDDAAEPPTRPERPRSPQGARAAARSPGEPAGRPMPDDRIRALVATMLVTLLGVIVRFQNLGFPTDNGSPVFDGKHCAPQAWQV